MAPFSPLASRAVYTRSELRRLLEPRSIAVVGASARAGSFGLKTLEQLSTFTGKCYPVNAKYAQILEHHCYPNLQVLPEVPDCVILAVGRELVIQHVLECADLGVGGVLIYASGFAETGKPEWVAAQAKLARIARERGIRLLGPNCMGLANYATSTIMSFVAYTAFSSPRPASIAIASQSGGISNALGQSLEENVSISQVVSSGNACDVDVADLVSYLTEVPSCKAIVCVFEGMNEPMRLMEAAQRAWHADKPLIVYKLAQGEQGAAAAVSHSGALAGSQAAYRAAFERFGVIEAERYEDVIELASFFAKAPRPKARGVASMSTSGGAAIMTADAAEAVGVSMPQPEAGTRAILESCIPDFGSPRNPCDVTAQVMGNVEALSACMNALLADRQYSALVMAQAQAYSAVIPRIHMLSKLAREYGAMACYVPVVQWAMGPGAPEAELDDRVALFRSMNRCFQALKHWHARDDRRQWEPRVVPRVAPVEARAQAAFLLADQTETTLTESQSKQVLAAYGIPTVQEILCRTPDEAMQVAARIGGKVVLKVESPDIPHKTEAGVIRLGMLGDAAVGEAFAAVMRNAARVAPPERINGVLVQEMQPSGAEVMVGARIDPQFGALIIVGLGGVFVELLKDTVVALAPVNHGEALSMLRSLKGQAVLDGFRGSPGLDRDMLADVICRLSELAADHVLLLSEFDVNPLICVGKKIVAVDALIAKKARS